jgi:hypothetical protein
VQASGLAHGEGREGMYAGKDICKRRVKFEQDLQTRKYYYLSAGSLIVVMAPWEVQENILFLQNTH